MPLSIPFMFCAYLPCAKNHAMAPAKNHAMAPCEKKQAMALAGLDGCEISSHGHGMIFRIFPPKRVSRFGMENHGQPRLARAMACFFFRSPGWPGPWLVFYFAAQPGQCHGLFFISRGPCEISRRIEISHGPRAEFQGALKCRSLRNRKQGVVK